MSPEINLYPLDTNTPHEYLCNDDYRKRACRCLFYNRNALVIQPVRAVFSWTSAGSQNQTHSATQEGHLNLVSETSSATPLTNIVIAPVLSILLCEGFAFGSFFIPLSINVLIWRDGAPIELIIAWKVFRRTKNYIYLSNWPRFLSGAQIVRCAGTTD